MWNYWSDVWHGFGLIMCAVAFTGTIMIGINYAQPNKRIGYKIEEERSTSSRLSYYEVVAVVRHGLNRTVFTSYSLQEAMNVLGKIQILGEAE